MVPTKFFGGDILTATSAEAWERRAPVGYFIGRLTGQPQPYAAEGAYILNPRARAKELAMQRCETLSSV